MKRRLKVILTLIITAAAIAGWSVRFCKINGAVKLPETKIYSLGERADYGEDFFYRSDESRAGYFITVKSARLITYDEFVSTYGEPEQSPLKPVFVYDVEAYIENENTVDDESKGIDLVNTRLVTINDSIQVDFTLFGVIYPNLSGVSGFSLKPCTAMTFHLPFTVYDESADMKEISSEEWYLLMSMYPTKKMISIK